MLQMQLILKRTKCWKIKEKRKKELILDQDPKKSIFSEKDLYKSLQKIKIIVKLGVIAIS